MSEKNMKLVTIIKKVFKKNKNNSNSNSNDRTKDCGLTSAQIQCLTAVLGRNEN